MRMLSIGWAVLLRFCALGLFVVAAIVYWGEWTPTTAAGLLAAGLACFAGSSLFVPEATARGDRRDEHRHDAASDEPVMRERVTTSTQVRERV